MPVKPYSGDTNESSKFEDLKDPDAAWLEFGCIASTTSLSIGVDPKKIEFDRVFVWTHPLGCTLLAMFQAVMRYGRQVACPLGNQTICMLVKCLPPGVVALAVQLGTRKPVVLPTYEDEYKSICRRRAAATRQAARELSAVGGRLAGTAPMRTVSDQILRVMAHGALERRVQAVDHYAAVKRCIDHYGWTIEAASLTRARDVPTTLDLDELDAVNEDEDDKFAAGCSPLEKWGWVVEEILRRGEDDFFEEDCYGLVTEKKTKQQHKASKEQWLVKAYWLLRHVGRLPDGDGGLTAAEQLEAMDRPGVLDGLHLNAHMCVMDTAAVQRADHARRHEINSSMPHPLLQPSVGMRMDAGERLAKLLDLESPYMNCGIPQQIVDIARRETFKQSTDSDHTFKKSLEMLVMELGAKNVSAAGTLGLLKAAATALGMELDCKKKRIHHPAATAKCGKMRVVESMCFTRFLPDIVDNWQLHSRRLGFKVATAEWERMHASVDEEDGALGMENDAELDASLFTQEHGVGDQRTEKIDGAALRTELTRLSNLQNRTPRDKRWLDWLSAADVAASEPGDDGMRSLTVTYGKSFSRAIGRRTASHPSMQHCPSGLRPLLIRHLYHDVDIANCHPTLMLQVAEKMEVPPEKIEPLREYVEHRQPMLERIAAHYGVPASKTKFAVLRVLNGGSLTAWVNDPDVGCTRGKDETQPDLRELEEVARVVRDAFFAMPEFKEHVSTLRTELRATRAAKIREAEARVKAASNAPAREQAQRELGNARRKASRQAVERSLLSACIFELEDMVLACIDKHFQTSGWVVSSLQFDGLHVEHKHQDTLDDWGEEWTLLTAAMRGAEAAVEQELKYKIKLVEKALYMHAHSHATLADADVSDALMAVAEQ